MIGQQLKNLRLSSGFDQQYLAVKLGISQCHISNIERGVKYPSLEILEMYATFFNREPVEKTILNIFS